MRNYYYIVLVRIPLGDGDVYEGMVLVMGKDITFQDMRVRLERDLATDVGMSRLYGGVDILGYRKINNTDGAALARIFHGSDFFKTYRR